MIRSINFFTCLFIYLILQACAGSGVAPVANREEVKAVKTKTTQRSTPVSEKESVAGSDKGRHIVVKGDTLYSIAWRYNRDYKEIADWNNITAPYTIYPGQIVRLTPGLKKQGVTLKPKPADKGRPVNTIPKTEPAVKPAPKKPKRIAKKPAVKPDSPKGPIRWSWPTRGKLLKSNSPTAKKGINISGKNGQLVKAAATGEVVYSGSGLRGYGKLIIIKHNETFLSAYAYNSELLVKEGDRVQAGQDISKMGQDHSGRYVLHFEIRKNGKSTNPENFLPENRA